MSGVVSGENFVAPPVPPTRTSLTRLLAQRRSDRALPREAQRVLQTVEREAREDVLAGVRRVRIRQQLIARRRERRAVIRREVVIHLHCRVLRRRRRCFCCQKYLWISGSAVSDTVPVVCVDARTSAISLPMTGSIVDVCPLAAASASRSTVRPLPYWKIPRSDERAHDRAGVAAHPGRVDVLVVHEEERLVLDDRPADAAARLPLVQDGLGRRLAVRDRRCGAR